jgi:hypothetical protein
LRLKDESPVEANPSGASSVALGVSNMSTSRNSSGDRSRALASKSFFTNPYSSFLQANVQRVSGRHVMTALIGKVGGALLHYRFGF